jgi:hypothetical protein
LEILIIPLPTLRPFIPSLSGEEAAKGVIVANIDNSMVVSG